MVFFYMNYAFACIFLIGSYMNYAFALTGRDVIVHG